MFIDKTYFIDPDINIPNSDEVEESLNRYITIYEKQILIKGLGYSLYKDLIDNYNALTDDKWRDLVQGKEYSVDGQLVKWEGLINSQKISLIAYYLHYFWLKGVVRLKTSTGVVINAHENSSNANASPEVSSSWNNCIDLYGHNVGYLNGSDFLLRSKSYQQKFINGGFNNERELKKLEPTLFNYIYYSNQEESERYPNWIFTELEKINSFGI